MPRSTIPPLLGRFSIVDPATGVPSLQFQKIWEQLFGNEAGTFQTATDAASAAAAAVPQTRKINTTTPIMGGGDLTADLNLSHNASGVTPGSYTSANITVDANGHVVLASNGTGGGGGGTSELFTAFSSSGNAGDLFASLGYYFTFPVACHITRMQMLLRPGAIGRTYTLNYAPFNTATNKITAAPTIVGTYTSTSTLSPLPVVYTLGAPLAISVGDTYAFWTSGTFATSTTNPDNYFSATPSTPITSFYFTIPFANGLKLASTAPTTSDIWTTASAVWSVSLAFTVP